MVFDRNSINVGRTIQDFGLGDLTGVYRNTAKLRAKGWLIVAFFDASAKNTSTVIDTLKAWSTLLSPDKVTILGVGIGERSDVEEFAKSNELQFPVVWDYNDYVAATWSVSALPSIYVTNTGGKVLARSVGGKAEELEAIHDLVAGEVVKAAEAARIAAEKAATEKAAADAAALTAAPAKV
jgi:peroxiredoxin